MVFISKIVFLWEFGVVRLASFLCYLRRWKIASSPQKGWRDSQWRRISSSRGTFFVTKRSVIGGICITENASKKKLDFPKLVPNKYATSKRLLRRLVEKMTRLLAMTWGFVIASVLCEAICLGWMFDLHRLLRRSSLPAAGRLAMTCGLAMMRGGKPKNPGKAWVLR